jgi:hypothetical protein
VDKEDRLRELIAEWAPEATDLERDALVFMFLNNIDAVKNYFEGPKTE